MGRHLGFLTEPVASLVHINCTVPDEHPSAVILGTERSGSGVIVETGGYVLTVGYVVLGAGDLNVVSAKGENFEGRIVHMDHESGLAMIHSPGLNGPAVSVGPSAEMGTGDPVVLLASKGEGEIRGNSGFITDVGPFDAHWEYMLDRAIKSTALNPGLGGGALISMDGKVRGTVSLNLHLIGTCSLSIPIGLYLAQRGRFLGHQEGDEKPHRPWLGLFPQALEKGVLVAGVVPGGPAEDSGIQTGDVVLSLNGEEVISRRAFYQRLWEGAAGDEFTLTLYREKSFRTVQVTSKSRAEFYR